MTSIHIADRFAWSATALAAIAAIAGLLGPVYRDSQAMVDQARGADLATLAIAVPTLVVGHRLVRRGSTGARVVVVAALGYLVYTWARSAWCWSPEH